MDEKKEDRRTGNEEEGHLLRRREREDKDGEREGRGG